jgi:hypothetical protein
MTNEERDLAFSHLKSEPHFEYFQENLRGLYLCNPEKAILLFKDLLKKTPEKYPTQHGNDMVIGGRVFMSGYVCNTETTKENINNLVSINVSNSDDDVRN